MQTPAGMLLQVYNPEFVSLSCAFLMGVCSILFAVSTSIEMATAVQFIAGIAQSATAISVLTTIDKRLGAQMVPLWFGVAVFYTFGSLMLMQYLQALIYETYSEWRVPFYFVGGCCIFLSVVSFILLTIESGSNQIELAKMEEVIPQNIVKVVSASNGEVEQSPTSIVNAEPTVDVVSKTDVQKQPLSKLNQKFTCF